MDGCNLNCRGCRHFSNLFTQGERISFESFCENLQQTWRIGLSANRPWYILGESVNMYEMDKEWIRLEI